MVAQYSTDEFIPIGISDSAGRDDFRVLTINRFRHTDGFGYRDSLFLNLGAKVS